MSKKKTLFKVDAEFTTRENNIYNAFFFCIKTNIWLNKQNGAEILKKSYILACKVFCDMSLVNAPMPLLEIAAREK